MKGFRILISICCSVFFSPSFATDLKDLSENADDIVLKETIDYRVINKKKAVKEYFKRIKILNEDSNDRGYFESYDQFSKIAKLELTVYDLNGKKLEKFKKGDFFDAPNSGGELYSESRILSLDLEKFSPPYIVEISSKIEYDGMLFYDFYAPAEFNQAVLSSSFTLTYPTELGINYKGFNNAPKPRVSEEGKETTMVWRFKELRAVKFEPYGPNSRMYFPYIKIYPELFYYDGYEGNLKDWASYNDFYYGINKDRDQLSESMKAKVDDLIAGIDDERERIDVLYDYLKENMRYVSVQLGIGGYQTFDAAYVEKNKFGDCKALSNFMGSMLSQAGIDNSKVIIKRGVEYYNPLDEDFVDMFLFNHAILYVPSQDMFIECTSNNYPLGYIGNDNANKKVLISTAEGPMFKHTPFMGKEENTKHTYTKVQIKASGETEIENTSTYSGERHDYYRFHLTKSTSKENEDNFIKSFPLGIKELRSYEYEIEPNDPIVRLKYSLVLPKYGSKAGKRVFIPIDPIHSEDFVPRECKKRKLPFYSKIEETVENEIEVIIPEGYEIEAMPNDNFSEETPYGDFRMTIQLEEQSIKIYKKWVSKIFEFPPEKYEEYRNTMKTFSGLDNGKIVLVKKRT